MKTIHFWKAYGISNQKNNVAIYFESHMAAIYFYKMAALKQVLPISQPSNTIVYEIYTFLENVWCKQSEKAMLPFAPSPIWSLSCISQYGCHETGFRQYLSL